MIMLVRGGKVDPERAPFDIDTQQSMVAALQKQYPFIEGSVVVPNGAIDTMFSSLRPAYEPVLWGYGTDRKGSYDGQIQNDSYRTQLGVLPEFQGHEIKRGDEDVSASKVRNALERDDKIFNMSGGEQLRDYLPVEKVAEYIVKISLQDKINGVINCCSGKPISIRKLVENYIIETNKNPPNIFGCGNDL